jgi:hypothetical protein
MSLTIRNQIQLATTASSVTNYYNGYTVVFTRLNKITGKKVVQRGIVTAYDGTTKVATIDTIWHQDIIPGPETSEKKDTYEIVPTYPDNRVSINPAMQAMDYITSERYGRGLNPTVDLNFPSWLESARICDTRSDVTIMHSNGHANIGDVYRYPATGPILFRGKCTGNNGVYYTYTDVIGKLTNAWNSWKTFPDQALIYYESRLYRASGAGTKGTTPPTHTSGTVNGLEYVSNTPPSLTRVSGTGNTSIEIRGDGNPVRSLINGLTSSGYSLYDSDGIDYWRYIGWESHDQREVTQFQTNLTVDTSLPLFDNMNSFLEHFGGILRYNNGQYYLEVEKGEGGIQATNDPRQITTDDIISKIRLTDEGIRNSFNSLTVAYPDPANKFEARNISFFNSEYLKSDRNVPRKGSLTIPGITNYYNARLLADKFLIKSRYNMTISFNMSPKGALLLAGRVIQVPYARYGWTDKKFRITDLTHNSDCTVDVVAEEYDDEFYFVKAVTKPPGTGSTTETIPTAVSAPSNVVATNNTTGNEQLNSITLTWTNAPGLAKNNVVTEIHGGFSPFYYLTIASIASNVVTVQEVHGLEVGNIVRVENTALGFVAGTTYYVKSVPSTTSFTLSTVKGGTTTTLTNAGSPPGFKINTTSIISEVPYPGSTYTDSDYGGEISRIEKFYWLRYRIN